MTFHLLFEQSGTFKNVLKSHNFAAYDYDIQNQYGETDYIIDLFAEIEKEYMNILYGTDIKTIFSNMHPNNDFIIAFFPCTHFSSMNQLQYRLYQNTKGEKTKYSLKVAQRLIARNNERAKFFDIYLKFTFICYVKSIPTIIENPSSGVTYLEQYSPIDIAYKELDRTLWGDKFKKPTNFFAINFDMVEKLMFYDKVISEAKIVDTHDIKGRSEMTSLYAENFYKRFLEGRVSQ